MMRNYPIGNQDFKEIRTAGKLYIDKTSFVYRMAHGDSKYIFLSRPRRFGKTLLTSTMQYYFEGHKELFEGLYIGEHETEWETYPVLRFDMSKAKKRSKEDLRNELSLQLKPYEELYGRDEYEKLPGQRLGGIIRRAYEKTGKKVVVLIDEYDAPLLEVISNDSVLDDIRYEMRDFYGILKPSDVYLRFVFLTGITKFSQLSIFSGLNNIKNISMLENYAAICGITKKELTEQMSEDIDMLAEKRNQTSEETLRQLIAQYDGYHFTWPSDDIFNPFSLMNAFSDGKIRGYWFETGTSAHTIQLLSMYNVGPTTAQRMETVENDFNVPIETSTDSIPLLYQSGYLTIKDYDEENNIYTLDIPNEEVRVGLMNSLLPHYLPGGMNPGMGVRANKMRTALNKEDIKTAMQYMKEILQMIPYTNNANSEGHYQRLLFCFFTMAGAECRLEEHTSAGRIDIVMRTRSRIYVVELKMDEGADDAMEQIDDKDYTSYFAGYTLPVTKVGVNIDSKQRTISEMIIKES